MDQYFREESISGHIVSKLITGFQGSNYPPDTIVGGSQPTACKQIPWGPCDGYRPRPLPHRACVWCRAPESVFWINTRLGEKHGLQTQKAQASDPVLLTLPSSGPEQGSHVCAPSVPRQHHGLPAPPHTRLPRPRPFPATHSRLTKSVPSSL